MKFWLVRYLNTNCLLVAIEVSAATKRNAEWKVQVVCAVERIISVQERA